MKNEKLKTAILEVMNEWQDEGWVFDDMWFGYDWLQNDLIKNKGFKKKELTIKDMKQAMKELRDAGKVEIVHTEEAEGKFGGSAWFLTEGVEL